MITMITVMRIDLKYWLLVMSIDLITVYDVKFTSHKVDMTNLSLNATLQVTSPQYGSIRSWSGETRMPCHVYQSCLNHPLGLVSRDMTMRE